MSNLTLFKQGNIALPDYLREPDEATKLLAGSGTGKSISIKGGVWRMVVGGEEVAKNEERAMNFVVLAVNPTNNRTYYEGKYEEGKVTDPTCWSADGIKPNDEVPAATRQCATCANCPQNIEGSGEGKSRACRYSRRLAVALENDLEGNIYRLQLPAKSIFGKPEGDKMSLQAYAKFLAGHGVPITGVVTEARFDTSEAVPVLKFRAVRPLTREEWESAKTAAASDDAVRAIEFKFTPSKGNKTDGPGASEYREPAPTAKVFTAAPAPAPAAEVAEPVKRASRKAEVAADPEPTQKMSAADILATWGRDEGQD
jgi:hypothetical protein